MDAFGVSVLVASAVALLFARPASTRSWRDTWTTARNVRHGFAIAFPVSIFKQKEAPETGGATFYQRAGLTCGGKLIDSWLNLCLEAIARTSTPGAEPTGDCTE